MDRHKPEGLLNPLPVPTRPWESIYMDFISSLPKVDRYLAVMVVINRLSKCATFVPLQKACGAEETATLFFKHIVKYWGFPQSIVSDRDTRFTSIFWMELFKLMGSNLNMSLSHHPQSNENPERFNGLLDEYLRHFASANQQSRLGETP